MRVLVNCEYSGRVREAFRAKGHDAWSCDLYEDAEDASPFHMKADALQVAYYMPWDLMICHPPCTHLAVSGSRHFAKKKADGRQDAALQFVQLLMDAPIERIALENPISIISSRIRKPDQVIQPWQFGHDASKATCLWLKNLPPLRPTELVEPRWVCCGNVTTDKYGCPNCCGDKKPQPRWGNQTDSGQNKLAPSDTRWKERSRTYQGIANAMAEMWG